MKNKDTKYYCDICGKEITWDQRNGRNLHFYYDVKTTENSTVVETVEYDDICTPCTRELLSVLKIKEHKKLTAWGMKELQ